MVAGGLVLIPGQTRHYQGLSACSSVMGSGKWEGFGATTRSLRASIIIRNRPKCRRSKTNAMR